MAVFGVVVEVDTDNAMDLMCMEANYHIVTTFNLGYKSGYVTSHSSVFLALVPEILF